MRVLCSRRRSRRPLPRLAPEKAREPAHVLRGGRAQPPQRHLRLGRGIQRPNTGQFAASRPGNHGRILDSFNHWDDIDVHFEGRTITSGGHGFCGIGRKRLLNILQERCQELGVESCFQTDVTDEGPYADADLVIASDGQQRHPPRYGEHFQPDIDVRLQVRVVGHTQEVRCLYLRLRGD